MDSSLTGADDATQQFTFAGLAPPAAPTNAKARGPCYDSDGSSGPIVMPRESGASSNHRAIGETMPCPNRGPRLLDRPVKPGDGGNGIQALATERSPSDKFRQTAMQITTQMSMTTLPSVLLSIS
jgi:hypothetical protein